jgi:hypothetical protein
LGVAVFLSILFSIVGNKISKAFRAIAPTPEFQSALADPTVSANPANNIILQAVRAGGISGSGNTGGVLQDSSFLQHIDPRLARPFLVGFSDAMDGVFLVAAGVMFLAFVLILFLQEVPLRNQSGIEALAAELIAEAGGVPRSRTPGNGDAVATPPVAVTNPASVDHRPGPVIHGQVTERGHTPLAGATLTLTDLSGRQVDRDYSDTGGHYRLGPPSGGSYLVICASTAYQPAIALVAVADVPVRHDVALFGAGASLSGTVYTAESSQPIAGAVVTLVDIRGDVVVTTTTAPDGRFRFLALAQGLYTLTVAATTLHPVARSVDVPTHGDLIHDVEVVVRVQLVGSVRTAGAGAPVPEVLTTLLDSDGHVVGSAMTDIDGEFVFDDLPAGAYTVIATGYPPVAAEVYLGLGTPNETVITLRSPSLADVAAGNGAVAGSIQREGGKHGHRRRA